MHKFYLVICKDNTMFKKSCLIIYSKLQYKLGQDFLDRKYNLLSSGFLVFFLYKLYVYPGTGSVSEGLENPGNALVYTE